MRVSLALALLLATASAASAEIALLGTASIPADAPDKSGLEGEVMKNDGVTSTNVKMNAFGGAGSAIAYTGKDDLYMQATDRGPGDGDAKYPCRAHLVRIKLDPAGATPVAVTIEKTIMLKNEADEAFVGSSRAFTNKTRLDPEGIRLAPNGKDFYISDEYGPFIYKFSPDGKKIGEVKVPDKFMVKSRSDLAVDEIRSNKSGRVTNRGFEGLAITPDGKKLFAILQSPLIQDCEDVEEKKVGVNARILEVELETGKTREFVYPMSTDKHGNNEILAINDHAFIVLERDSKDGKKADFKKIFRIDLEGATDVSGVEKLPPGALPDTIKPVSKTLFLDMLDPKFKLAGPGFPEKIEGLSWGPNLGGKHTLVITTDNDFLADKPSYYWVFTVDPSDVSGYVPQKFE